MTYAELGVSLPQWECWDNTVSIHWQVCQGVAAITRTTAQVPHFHGTS